jgi:hypothetical protein
MIPHTVLENFIIVESAAAWATLIEMDRERGGSGKLRDAALSLARGRTIIAVHSDFHDDNRTLTVWFELPQPLLPGMRELVCEFMLDLLGWLEGRQAAPKLPVPQPRVTLH